MQRNFADLVMILLGAGADVHRATDDGLTILMLAAKNRNLSLATEFIDRDVALDAASSEGMTALMFAAAEGDLPLVSLLIKRGADVHARNRAAHTAERIARDLGHAKVASFITAYSGEKSADPAAQRPVNATDAQV